MLAKIFYSTWMTDHREWILLRLVKNTGIAAWVWTKNWGWVWVQSACSASQPTYRLLGLVVLPRRTDPVWRYWGVSHPRVALQRPLVRLFFLGTPGWGSGVVLWCFWAARGTLCRPGGLGAVPRCSLGSPFSCPSPSLVVSQRPGVPQNLPLRAKFARFLGPVGVWKNSFAALWLVYSPKTPLTARKSPFWGIFSRLGTLKDIAEN